MPFVKFHPEVASCLLSRGISSGVARAFPGGRVAHPEDQNEEENLRKNEGNYGKMRKYWGNILILPTREWEAGYGPGHKKVCTPGDEAIMKIHKKLFSGIQLTSHVLLYLQNYEELETEILDLQ